ncbi:MAG: proline--tRNA ligase [Myxococcales bacterium]|nr:proline--tRNA ligase [Myxococcales bacterium]
MADQGSSITPRAEDYSQWYLDIIAQAELADYTPVKGCMVFRPNGFAIWDLMKCDLDQRFKDTGHVNAYFPLLIPVSFLSKEAQHVEGFAKECAVVTHHRLRAAAGGGVEPDPASKLEEPLVIRPTSETIIWHMYGQWIQSWRDLPILINQWANVVRWEMKTRPFLRTAEFLWQEGHTAHATSQEAVEETLRMLDVYEAFAKDVMAMPVIKGVKSSSERFAGALDTYCIEALMQNGWALQAGTSHFLGQNFAKAFDVTFQAASGEREHVWATSWGVSTRMIGAVIMTHSDDTGLVLPPALAPVQVVITPIWKSDAEREIVLGHAEKVRKALTPAFRVKVDARDTVKPGAKYFEWERKGVPLRLEIGPRDAAGDSVFAAPRIPLLARGGKKFGIPAATVADGVREVLAEIQQALYDAALERRASTMRTPTAYDAFKADIEKGGFVQVSWADDAANEETIKEETKATIRCYPLVGQEAAVGTTCFYSGRPATHIALFARAF